MKHLRSQGMGVQKKQAEPITSEEENLLWEKGALGDSTPQVLLDTMLYLCGIHFALRSGEEHRSLQLSQFQLVCPTDGSPHLIYTENYSKNNQGGLQHRKVKPKFVTCYANEQDPQRCLVKLFEKYLQHCPPECNHFYLTPLRKPRGDIWYSKSPVGHNKLPKTVARICQTVGISCLITNHSLRVTSATRLFQSGIDEQLIMAHTGHRSVDGVRSYKRISTEQKMTVSNVLNSYTGSTGTDEHDTETEINSLQCTKKQKLNISESHSRSQSQPVAVSLRNSQSTSWTPSFTFNGCTSITINYNNAHCHNYYSS